MYHVGFSLTVDVEVGGEVGGEDGGEDGGEIGALYLRKTIFFGILQR